MVTISAIKESGNLGDKDIKKSIKDIGGSFIKQSSKVKDDATDKLRSSTKEKGPEAVDKLKSLLGG